MRASFGTLVPRKRHDEPHELADTGPVAIVERDDSPFAEHPIDVEELDQRLIKAVPTIDERKVELSRRLRELWQDVTRTETR